METTAEIIGRIFNQTHPENLSSAEASVWQPIKRVDNDAVANTLILSNDPRVIGKPNTPKPVICEYCGAERYTERNYCKERTRGIVFSRGKYEYL